MVISGVSMVYAIAFRLLLVDGVVVNVAYAYLPRQLSADIAIEPSIASVKVNEEETINFFNLFNRFCLFLVDVGTRCRWFDGFFNFFFLLWLLFIIINYFIDHFSCFAYLFFNGLLFKKFLNNFNQELFFRLFMLKKKSN